MDVKLEAENRQEDEDSSKKTSSRRTNPSSHQYEAIDNNKAVLKTGTSTVSEAAAASTSASALDDSHYYGQLVVTVTDTGVGLTAEQIGKLFHEGVQFSVNELQAGQGSGLGLCIAKGIVEAHQGSLCVTSPGIEKGTTFALTLDVVFTPSSSSSSSSSSSPSLSTNPPPQSTSYSNSNSSDNIRSFSTQQQQQQHQLQLQSQVLDSHGADDSAASCGTAHATDGAGSVGVGTTKTTASPVAGTSTHTTEVYEKQLQPPQEVRSASCVNDVPTTSENLPGIAGAGAAAGGGAEGKELLRKVSRTDSFASNKTAAASSTTGGGGTERNDLQRKESKRGFVVSTGAGADTATDGENQLSNSKHATKKKVLIVDDVASTRKMLIRVLKQGGYICEQAEDGSEALQKVKERGISRPFDTILMDFEMPIMNGPDATALLRSMGYTGLILGATGNLLPDDVAHFKKQGADAVVGKPLSLRKLQDAWTALDKERQQQP